VTAGGWRSEEQPRNSAGENYRNEKKRPGQPAEHIAQRKGENPTKSQDSNLKKLFFTKRYPGVGLEKIDKKAKLWKARGKGKKRMQYGGGAEGTKLTVLTFTLHTSVALQSEREFIGTRKTGSDMERQHEKGKSRKMGGRAHWMELQETKGKIETSHLRSKLILKTRKTSGC